MEIAQTSCSRLHALVTRLGRQCTNGDSLTVPVRETRTDKLTMPTRALFEQHTVAVSQYSTALAGPPKKDNDYSRRSLNIVLAEQTASGLLYCELAFCSAGRYIFCISPPHDRVLTKHSVVYCTATDELLKGIPGNS